MRSRFSIYIIFSLLTSVGWLLVPRLPFRLEPSQQLPTLSINFQWAQASPELIEQQATSVIEAMLANMEEIREIQSTTLPEEGEIRLTFDHGLDMNMVQFEVSARLRQLRNRLPEGMSWPQVSHQHTSEKTEKSLITYTLSGPTSADVLFQYAEERLKPRLAQIDGVSRVEVYGNQPTLWELTYHPDQLQAFNLSPSELARIVQEPFFRADLSPNRRLQATLDGKKGDFTANDILDWPISASRADSELTMVKLGDLLSLAQRPQRPSAYFRINGLSAVNLLMYSEASANQLSLNKAVISKMDALTVALPSGYVIRMDYNATDFLRQELIKIGWRSMVALLLLLVFVGIASRSWVYVGQIFLGLIATLGIAALGAYFLQVELHLYSLAGLTLSFGLVIDNTLVMSEHIRQHRNRRVFVALLAATLTTLGAVSVVFVLDESTQRQLLDFVKVMGLCLAVSLLVGWWLIPAMMDRVGPTNQGRSRWSRRRLIVRGLSNYARLITRARKKRARLIVLGILGFGIPIFLLPSNIEGWKGYNETVGSVFYQQSVRPWLDKALGGSFRLFVQKTFVNAYTPDLMPTVLAVRATLPNGATIEQVNETLVPIENYLAQFEEIDQFQTSIRGKRTGRILILFHEDAEYSAFPQQLKGRLISRVSQLTGAEWSVSGLGRMFRNVAGLGAKNSQIVLKGYNYEELRQFGERVKAELLQNPRVDAVYLNGMPRTDYRSHDEYVLGINAQSLAMFGSSPQAFWMQLSQQSLTPNNIGHAFIDGKYLPLILTPSSLERGKKWQVMASLIPGESPPQSTAIDEAASPTQIRLREVATVMKEPANQAIERKNQEYQLFVEYDFIGPISLIEKVARQAIDKANTWLPPGYRAEPRASFGWGWNREDPLQYGMLLPVLLIILVICAILLESLRQPLAVISLVPISFIGVFLTFHVFSVNFDQGGYASFLLLSGISVNAGLYLINDYNLYRRRYPHRSNLSCYLKAVQSKMMPIMLTILSTMLGMIPFLMGGAEPFWYALAMGTMGGLLFSMLGILLYLPAWLT